MNRRMGEQRPLSRPVSISHGLNPRLLGLELLGVPALIVSSEAEILAANAAAENLFGYAADGLAAVGMPELLQEGQHELYLRHLKACIGLSPGSATPKPFRCILRRGQRREIDTEVVLAAIQQEGASAALNLFLPTPEGSEEELRATYDRMEQILAHCPVPFFLLDSDGTIEDCNEAFLRCLGYREGRLAGRKLSEITQAEGNEATAGRLFALAEIGTGFISAKLRTADERVLPAEIWASPLRINDVPFVSCFIREVIGFQGLEDHLEPLSHVLACLDQPVFLARADGRLLIANEAARRSLGRAKEGRLCHRISFLDPDVELSNGRRHRDAQDTLGVDQPDDRRRGAGGEVLSIASRGTEFKYRGRHYFLAVADTSAESGAQVEHFLDARRMELLGRFAGGLAHLFSNMLTVVLGSSERLLGGIKPQDPVFADLEAIRDASQSAVTLIGQLQEFCQRQTHEPAQTDLNDIVQKTVVMISRLIGEHIIIALDLVRQPTPVRVDSAQIELIIALLAADARDTMPGGGVLAIRTSTVGLDGVHAGEAASDDREGCYFVLRVSVAGSDAGPDSEANAAPSEHLEKESRRRPTSAWFAAGFFAKNNGGFLKTLCAGRNETAYELYLPRAAEVWEI